MFQLLVGKVRYNLKNLPEEEIAQAISEGRFLDWDSLPPHVGSSTRTLLEKATSLSEKDRYRNMSDFSIALNNLHKKQLNWRYESGAGRSFTLQRAEGNKLLKIDVTEVDKRTFNVQRHKKVAAEFRRSGESITIRHANLARCQEFQRLLHDSW